MKNLLRAALAAVLVLPLAGCLVMPYEMPTDGPRAEFSIRNRTPAFMSISLYEDARECRRRHNLLPITKAYQTRNIIVVAGGDLTVTLGGGVGNMGCAPTFTFAPVEDHFYDIVFGIEGAYCTVEITDVTGGKRRPVKFRKRAFKTAFDEMGPFCDAND